MQKAYGTVDFDDLSIVTETGIRLHSAFEGKARVDQHGVIVEILIDGVNMHGQRGLLRIEPEDGQLYADLHRTLVKDYAEQITWAASAAYFQARRRVVA